MIRTVESLPRTSIRSGPFLPFLLDCRIAHISEVTKPDHMRFISAILVTSVIASIGVQGLRPPEQPTRRSYGSSSLVPMSSEKDKPTETTTVPPIRTSVSTDTEFVWTSTPVTTNTDIIRTSTAAPSTATDVPQKDEGACEKFAFFHDWDVEYGDVSSLSCLPAPQ